VGGVVSATKAIHTFSRPVKDGPVKIDKGTTPLTGIEKCFRPASPRVMMMARVASLISAENQGQSIDSAEMGFEMTEGVGQVSFDRGTS
jgi:hypothetical protein